MYADTLKGTLRCEDIIIDIYTETADAGEFTGDCEYIVPGSLLKEFVKHHEGDLPYNGWDFIQDRYEGMSKSAIYALGEVSFNHTDTWILLLHYLRCYVPGEPRVRANGNPFWVAHDIGHVLHDVHVDYQIEISPENEDRAHAYGLWLTHSEEIFHWLDIDEIQKMQDEFYGRFKTPSRTLSIYFDTWNEWMYPVDEETGENSDTVQAIGDFEKSAEYEEMILELGQTYCF